MSVRLVIVVLFCYGTLCVNSVIIGASKNHHVNLISRENKLRENPTITENPTDDSTVIGNQSSLSKNAITDHKQTTKKITPFKTPMPNLLDRKAFTIKPRIAHEISPQKTDHHTLLDSKKTPTSLLKQEAPKSPKKMHRFSIDDLIQKRKEIKEKWQARHNKLWNRTAYNKEEEHPKLIAKHREPIYLVGKPAVPLHAMTKKQNIVTANEENLRKHIGNMYEQVTPRTRRILEHIEDIHSSDKTKYLHSQKTKPSFSAKFNDRHTSTIPPYTNFVTEALKTQMKTENPSESSESNTEVINEHTTESKFDIANYVYELPPYIPIMPEMYWSRELSTTLYPPQQRESAIPTHTSELIGSTHIKTKEELPESYLLQMGSNLNVTAKKYTTESKVDTSTEKNIFPIESKTEASDSRQTTENQFNVANYVYELPPYIPIMPEMYWSRELSTTLYPPKHRESANLPHTVKTIRHAHSVIKVDESTEVNTPPIESKTARSDSKLTTESKFNVANYWYELPPFIPLMTEGYWSQELSTASTPSKRRESSVSSTPTISILGQTRSIFDDPIIKSQNSGTSTKLEDNSTATIDNTEIISHKDTSTTTKPGHNLEHATTDMIPAKSAGEVGQESVENKSKSSIEDNKQSRKTDNSSEGNAMKISPETQVNQDWRLHLRKAVKERLRNLRRDSAEN